MSTERATDDGYSLDCCCDISYREGVSTEPDPCPQCDIHGDGSHPHLSTKRPSQETDPE
jgi:hypothetical protein